MSTELHEKLILIKTAENLSNPEFAEKIGVSENTLKGIWKRGSTPKGDILEKTAAIWPKYAYWLMTGKEDFPRHISPLNKNSERKLCRLVDVIHNVTNLDGPIRAEWFVELIFLQVKEDLSDLACLIKVKKEDIVAPNHQSYVLLSDGINLVSNGGGKLKLVALARKLTELGREDLIRTATSRLIARDDLTNLKKLYQLDESLIEPMHIYDDKTQQLHMNFSKWRLEGANYTPETWDFY